MAQNYWGKNSIADSVYNLTYGEYLHTNLDSFAFRKDEKSGPLNQVISSIKIDSMIKKAEDREQKIYQLFGVKNITDLNEKYSMEKVNIKNDLIFQNLVDDFSKNFNRGIKIELEKFNIERQKGGRKIREASKSEIKNNIEVQRKFLQQKIFYLTDYIEKLTNEIEKSQDQQEKNSLERLKKLVINMTDKIGIRVNNIDEVYNGKNNNFINDYTEFNKGISDSVRNITGFGNEYAKNEAIPIFLNILQKSFKDKAITFSSRTTSSSNEIEDLEITFEIPQARSLDLKKIKGEKIEKIGISNKFAKGGYKPIIKNPTIGTLRNYFGDQKNTNQDAINFFEWYAANYSKFQAQGKQGFPSNMYNSLKNDGLFVKIFQPLIMDLFSTSIGANKDLGGNVDFIMFNDVFLEKSKVLYAIKTYVLLKPEQVTRSNIFEISIVKRKEIGGFDIPNPPERQKGYVGPRQSFSYDDSKVTGFSMVHSGWMDEKDLAELLVKKYRESLSTNLYLKFYIGELYSQATGRKLGGTKIKKDSNIFELFKIQ